MDFLRIPYITLDLFLYIDFEKMAKKTFYVCFLHFQLFDDAFVFDCQILLEIPDHRLHHPGFFLVPACRIAVAAIVWNLAASFLAAGGAPCHPAIIVVDAYFMAGSNAALRLEEARLLFSADLDDLDGTELLGTLVENVLPELPFPDRIWHRLAFYCIVPGIPPVEVVQIWKSSFQLLSICLEQFLWRDACAREEARRMRIMMDSTAVFSFFVVSMMAFMCRYCFLH